MQNAYPGLSAAEFEDIHNAVLEAMGFVLRPAVLHLPVESAVDDLYGEAVGGQEPWEDLPEIGASIRYNPNEETLTRYGLKTEAEVLLFIPRGEVARWEAANGRAFLPREAGHEITAQGRRFNVFEVRTDPLPVGDGQSEDYIGMVVTGYKEK
jgi:hypothetical protein